MKTNTLRNILLAMEIALFSACAGGSGNADAVSPIEKDTIEAGEAVYSKENRRKVAGEDVEEDSINEYHEYLYLAGDSNALKIDSFLFAYGCISEIGKTNYKVLHRHWQKYDEESDSLWYYAKDRLVRERFCGELAKIGEFENEFLYDEKGKLRYRKQGFPTVHDYWDSMNVSYLENDKEVWRCRSLSTYDHETDEDDVHYRYVFYEDLKSDNALELVFKHSKSLIVKHFERNALKDSTFFAYDLYDIRRISVEELEKVRNKENERHLMEVEKIFFKYE